MDFWPVDTILSEDQGCETLSHEFLPCFILFHFWDIMIVLCIIVHITIYNV